MTVDIKPVCRLILDNEDWLMDRILHYAKLTQFTMYTSTLKEAWRMSIAGLSRSLIATLEGGGAAELSPQDDYAGDPMAQFGVMEAKRHRARGISPAMFLGLFKYYKQTYRDLAESIPLAEDGRRWLLNGIERFYDRVEIAFLQHWIQMSGEDTIAELQVANRSLTNEKNKYLTIFESIAEPVVLLDSRGRVENLNMAAMSLLQTSSAPGKVYYSAPCAGEGKDGEIISGESGIKGRELGELFPNVVQAMGDFDCGEGKEISREITLATPRGKRRFEARITPMLDVSNKFTGTTLTFQDVTDHYRVEEMLKNSQKELESRVRKRTMELQSINRELAEEVRERKLAEAALRFVVEGTSFTEGKDFFHSLVKHVASAFDISLALVAELVDAQNKRCKTLSIWKDGGYEKNFEFSVEGMPCEAAYESREIVYHPSNVLDLFPRNEYMAQVNAVGYISLPLLNSEGKVIGHVSLIDTKPIAKGKYFNSVLRTLAMRASSELERKRAVTERENLQKRLAHAEKLSFIGTFISSVAHELNNPLGIVLGFSQRLARNRGLSAEALSDLEIIASESKRAADIVRNLLEISRKQKPLKTPLSVNAVLEKAVRMQVDQNGEYGSWLKIELDGDLPPVIGNASQLQQVFVNIIVNAFQALRRGTVRPGEILCSTRRHAGEARIIFSNNGPSIPEAIIDRVFEPFFTAADTGEGTGLGLYVAHGIVEDMGGRMWVENQAQGGVAFHISLPACREETDLNYAEPLPRSAMKKGMRALVVDNEANLLKWLSRILGDAGVSVTTAEDGACAIHLVEMEKYDIIISDVKMPRMDGLAFMRWLNLNKPGYLKKLVITTGVIDDAIRDYCRTYGCECLVKPFVEERVLEIVNRVSEKGA